MDKDYILGRFDKISVGGGDNQISAEIKLGKPREGDFLTIRRDELEGGACRWVD
jgi:hypothetical protein